MLFTVVRVSLAILVVAFCATAQPSLDSLYANNQWFQLRDAVRADSAAPPFFRGIVALAFHQWEQAEHDLQTSADAAPPIAAISLDTVDQASQSALAMKALADLNTLRGRYKDAAADTDRFVRYLSSLASLSDRMRGELRRTLRSYRAMAAVTTRFPDQEVVRRGYSRMLYSASRSRPVVPVTIAGKTTSMMLDTGSEANYIGPSDAKRLGLAVHSAPAELEGYDGANEKARGVALADDLTIGNFQFRHVAFIVLNKDEYGEPGIIGLPLLYSLETIRWRSDGAIEFGFPSNAAEPNLAFSDGVLLTEAVLGKERLMLSVDTGADETLVHPSFAQAIGAAMGAPLRKSLDHDALAARHIPFFVAAFPALLGNGTLAFTKRTGDFDGIEGNLGVDILGQGAGVTLDLAAMRLTVDAGESHGGYIAGKPVQCALPPGFACQQGFTCAVWFDKDDPCTIDRVTPGVLGGEIPRPRDGCVVPAGFSCGATDLCTIRTGANGACDVRKTAAVQQSAPIATPAVPETQPAASPVVLSQNLTDQELQALLRRTLGEDNLNFEPSRNYIYTEERETRNLDAKGNVTSTESETRESIVLYGERYDRLIQKDGKPLPPKQQHAEQEKLDKESRRRAAESADARARRTAQDKQKNQACYDEFLSAFRFHVVGVDTASSRPAWKIEAEPLPAAHPRCDLVKKAASLHWWIWIDQTDKEWSKVEVDNIAPITWGAVLVRAPAGTFHLTNEMTRRDDGAWLPAHLRVRFDLKLLLLKTFRLEIVSTYSDYKKFQADSKVIPLDK